MRFTFQILSFLLLPIFGFGQGLDLRFESLQQCHPARNYLDSQLAQLRSQDRLREYFTTAKTRIDNQIPQACIHYIMQSQNGENPNEARPRWSSALCSSDLDYPKMGQMSPCLTEDYVQVVYNAFIDVGDCLGIPHRLIVPKISVESGFHINAINPIRGKVGGKLRILNSPEQLKGAKGLVGGDAGIGQLTEIALKDVKDNMDWWRSAIVSSKRPSCQRLHQLLGSIPDSNHVETKLAHRCSVIHSPKNPIHNLLFSGILFNRMKEIVDQSWHTVGISKLLSQAGIRPTEKEQKKIREMILLLGYNIGPVTAMTYFKEWLEFRLEDQARGGPVLTKDDFNMGVRPKTDKVLIDSGSMQIAFSKLSSLQIEQLKKELGSLRKARAQGQLSAIQSQRLLDLESLRFSPMAFSSYLYFYQTESVRDYLTKLKSKHSQLTKVFGEGVCTETSFLSF